MISGIVDAIPHFLRRRFARRAYVPIVCGLIGMHATGWRRIDATRTVFTPVKPCLPRHDPVVVDAAVLCPDVRFSGTGRTARSLWENQSEVEPLLLPFVAVFLRSWLFPPRAVPPFPWPDPRRHINYPANGRSFGIIRNLIHDYMPRLACVCTHAYTYVCICMCV